MRSKKSIMTLVCLVLMLVLCLGVLTACNKDDNKGPGSFDIGDYSYWLFDVGVYDIPQDVSTTLTDATGIQAYQTADYTMLSNLSYGTCVIRRDTDNNMAVYSYVLDKLIIPFGEYATCSAAQLFRNEYGSWYETYYTVSIDETSKQTAVYYDANGDIIVTLDDFANVDLNVVGFLSQNDLEFVKRYTDYAAEEEYITYKVNYETEVDPVEFTIKIEYGEELYAATMPTYTYVPQQIGEDVVNNVRKVPFEDYGFSAGDEYKDYSITVSSVEEYGTTMYTVFQVFDENGNFVARSAYDEKWDEITFVGSKMILANYSAVAPTEKCTYYNTFEEMGILLEYFSLDVLTGTLTELQFDGIINYAYALHSNDEIQKSIEAEANNEKYSIKTSYLYANVELSRGNGSSELGSPKAVILDENLNIVCDLKDVYDYSSDYCQLTNDKFLINVNSDMPVIVDSNLSNPIYLNIEVMAIDFNNGYVIGAIYDEYDQMYFGAVDANGKVAIPFKYSSDLMRGTHDDYYIARAADKADVYEGTDIVKAYSINAKTGAETVLDVKVATALAEGAAEYADSVFMYCTANETHTQFSYKICKYDGSELLAFEARTQVYFDDLVMCQKSDYDAYTKKYLLCVEDDDDFDGNADTTKWYWLDTQVRMFYSI